MTFIQSPLAHRVDSPGWQQKTRQTQSPLTSAVRSMPQPARHSRLNLEGRVCEKPGTDTPSHQSYYSSFYRSEERQDKKYALVFHPQFTKSSFLHFSQPCWEMGTASSAHLAGVSRRTLGQPLARAVCQAGTMSNEASVPYLCRGRPSPHGQDGVTQKNGVEGRVGGAWGRSVRGRPVVG